MVHSDRPSRLCHRHFLPVHRHHVEQDKIDSYTQLSSPMRSPFQQCSRCRCNPARRSHTCCRGRAWGSPVHCRHARLRRLRAQRHTGDHECSEWVGPRPAQSVEHQANQQDRGRYATLTRHEPVTASMRVTRPSAVSMGLPSAMRVRALPAASATITRKVSAVQMMPSIDGAGRPPVAKV